ncbi:hypothetical protein [Aurantiacibacter poecillastricola]|uniref:hypothetical protein n=1 Tax=Aurantiacibacter poecillastricola TaxID=3064385 RepID=UPI00273DB8ED|nr:hypothetical protein [Aurantiacibacter sp. 219JJ12-13]MDP5261490.1 hypothetical protein [Aurantiacibacter sp. 219JJ12-13]
MAEQLTREQLALHADLVEAPRVAPPTDRTFELPTALYGATVALFLGFIGTLAIGFGNPEMVIPFVIFALFVVAGFGVPAVWTRLAPTTRSRAKSLATFQQEGIMTAYGRTSARDATIQVLILPTLIFAWGLICVTIAALV